VNFLCSVRGMPTYITYILVRETATNYFHTSPLRSFTHFCIRLETPCFQG